ncbi:MAG: pirin family protein [Planctomycetota bacterium]|nr:pirin family protein [Planctomycetota bacterium]
MITIRRSRDRGHRDFGWLSARHTFSFGSYHDARWMGFRHLRVLNEDWIQPAKGFGMHPHEDMEIITYVLEGALRHADSVGNKGVIRPWQVQRMSAGRGIRHSEFNASAKEPVHLMQIWLLPDKRGHKPSYEDKTFAPETRRNRLALVASPDGADGSVTIHQDARLYATVLEKDKKLVYAPATGRHVWIQIARGRVRLGEQVLEEGDGAAIHGEKKLALEALDGAELLLFDLA